MSEKKLAKITNDTLSAVQNIFERKLGHLKIEDAVEVIRRVARLIDPRAEEAFRILEEFTARKPRRKG